ncbi:hypothetical protein WJX73_006323 [Symbiochloris irregularis]|uniref:Fungal lipase-type domain-containing protein n=1 Tax=Symbiochloris irregularis TaxID=706552 RepID=A0AAW1PH84_9CHLO
MLARGTKAGGQDFQQPVTHAETERLRPSATQRFFRCKPVQPAANGSKDGNKITGLLRQKSNPKLPLTLSNLPAPSFNPPPNYSAMHFPWTEAAGWLQGSIQRACLAHFMSQCARLGYESSRAIGAVVDGMWGCELIAYGLHTGKVPVSWYAFSNCEAVVLSFTGGSALSLLSWGAESSVTVSERAGMGSVSDMYTDALFNLPQGADECAFDAALAAVAHLAGTRSLLLAGHGSGGALACIFALGLKLKRPHLSRQVEGIYTFGQPCAGDAAFADKLRAAYSGRLHCFELPADLCPRLPPSHKFAATLKRSTGRGSRYCVKMLPPPAHSSWAQLLTKTALSLMPGVWQHQPWAYEQALRERVGQMPVLQQADEEHDESAATTGTLPPSEVLNARWAHAYPKGLFDSTVHTSERSPDTAGVAAAWAAKQSSAVLTQSASPTGSLISALSDLRRGGPHQADVDVSSQQTLHRHNRDSNVWNIGTGRQGSTQPWQGSAPQKAPSIQTAADTVYWSMHDGLPAEQTNDRALTRPSRLQLGARHNPQSAVREQQGHMQTLAGEGSTAPRAQKSGLYITPLEMSKAGPTSPTSNAGTQTSTEQDLEWPAPS